MDTSYLTREELVLVAKERDCDIGGTVTICGQKFRMCILGSNSIYMHTDTQTPVALTPEDFDLNQEELLLVARHRKCDVGGAITIGTHEFLMCLSKSNSAYMRDTTKHPEPELVA